MLPSSTEKYFTGYKNDKGQIEESWLNYDCIKLANVDLQFRSSSQNKGLIITRNSYPNPT